MTGKVSQIPKPPSAHWTMPGYSGRTVFEDDGTRTKYRQKTDYARWRQTAPWEIRVETDKKWWQFWRGQYQWKKIEGKPPKYG